MTAGLTAASQPADDLAPVDERNPFWPKYRDIAERVTSQAKEPFEIADGAAPCAAETMAMAVRYAVRLALKEADADPGKRAAILARVSGAMTGAGGPGGQDVLDAVLRDAALRALAASGVEERWREAAAFQEAWDRTETRPSALPRTARWLAQLWPIAAGIATGAIVGVGSAFTYYYIIAPLSRAAGP